jgi:hypothetical protein
MNKTLEGNINKWLEYVDKFIKENKSIDRKILPDIIREGKILENQIDCSMISIKDAINIMALTDQLDYLQKMYLSKDNQIAIDTIIKLLDTLDINNDLRIPWKCSHDYIITIRDGYILITKK